MHLRIWNNKTELGLVIHKMGKLRKAQEAPAPEPVKAPKPKVADCHEIQRTLEEMNKAFLAWKSAEDEKARIKKLQKEVEKPKLPSNQWHLILSGDTWRK
jgi:hypothetical protein